VRSASKVACSCPPSRPPKPSSLPSSTASTPIPGRWHPVQSPLPKHIDELMVFRRISPAKDVDGLGTMNLGKVAQDDDTGFVSCTPAGIMELLVRHRVDLKGKHVVVLGRSLLVGKPIALLVLQKRAGANGTVTVCHSATPTSPRSPARPTCSSPPSAAPSLSPPIW